MSYLIKNDKFFLSVQELEAKTLAARFDGSREKSLWIKYIAIARGTCAQSCPQNVCGTWRRRARLALGWACRIFAHGEKAYINQRLCAGSRSLRTILSTKNVQKG
jgi:hypothetical protein